jgi:hypothetical protein
MSSIKTATTFNQEGLELYGQRFLNSYAERVGKRIKLLCYAEKCSPINPDPKHIKILNVDKLLPKLIRFKEKWKDVPKANGVCPYSDVDEAEKCKTFKWNAVRFAHKSYAMLDACQRSKDWCVWMDADIFVHSYWGYDDFIKILPNNKWLTYVGRPKRAPGNLVYPETGFWGINMNHDISHRFLQEYERTYEEAEDRLFTLPQFHDCIVFQRALDNCEDYKNQTVNYTEDSIKGGHPMVNGVLGAWIDHLKGDRKKAGKSRACDITTERPEKYWKP